MRKPQITPRRPPFEESRHQIISVEDNRAAVSKGHCHDSKIFKARERAELYDNLQPPTSYQLPQVDSSPKLKPNHSKFITSTRFKFISSSLSCFQRRSIGLLRRLNMKQMSTTIDVTDATSNIVMEPANYPPIETPIDF